MGPLQLSLPHHSSSTAQSSLLEVYTLYITVYTLSYTTSRLKSHDTAHHSHCASSDIPHRARVPSAGGIPPDITIPWTSGEGLKRARYHRDDQCGAACLSTLQYIVHCMYIIVQCTLAQWEISLLTHTSLPYLQAPSVPNQLSSGEEAGSGHDLGPGRGKKGRGTRDRHYLIEQY